MGWRFAMVAAALGAAGCDDTRFIEQALIERSFFRDGVTYVRSL
jgi:hypothetical protein